MEIIKVGGALNPSTANTPLDARTVVDSLDNLGSILNPCEGLIIVDKSTDSAYIVTGTQRSSSGRTYIDRTNLKPLASGSGGGLSMYFSEDGITPTDVNVIWVDGADQQTLDESTFDKIRTELNKLDNRINNIEYAFDIALDSGDTNYYKGSDTASIPGVKPDADYDMQLSFTYDGEALVFSRADNSTVGIQTVANKIQLKNGEEIAKECTFDSPEVNIGVDGAITISSMNYLEFDEFTLYNNDTIVYQCDISSAALIENFSWVDRLQPNVHHIKIKRAKTADSIKEYPIQDGELLYSIAENKLYIGNGGRAVTVGGSGGSGSGNVTASYIDLIASDDSSITYRITVDSTGNLSITKKDEDDDTPSQKPLAAGARNLKGLVMDMLYAGPKGANAVSDNICSHSYIELYNSTGTDINLKGCSICIGVTAWDAVVPLKGTVPAHGYYLIRLNPVSNTSSSTTKVVIDKFDLDAYAINPKASITSQGFKAYLQVGLDTPTEQDPWNSGNGKIKESVIGYVDLVGCMGKNATGAPLVNAGEFPSGSTASANSIVSEVRGMYRNYIDSLAVNGISATNAPMGDSDNNIKDFRAFDYSSNISPITGIYMGESTTVYKPKTSKDGTGDLFRFKSKFLKSTPNMPTMCIGEVPTTRTFTWISMPNQDEFLFYRKVDNTEGGMTPVATAWIAIESEKTGTYARQRITAEDGQVYTVHKAFIRDLTTGNYKWCVGTKNGNEPGSYKSSEYNFTIEASSLASEDGSFTFCQISDQQGWAFNEYDPWSLAMKQIISNFNGNNNNKFPTVNGANKGISFFINTGDMSQNGSRPSEWLDYYNAASQVFPNVPQMNCVGNNDLCPGAVNTSGTQSKKVLPTTFEYYYTYEYSNNAEENSLQKVSDGYMKSVYAFDYGCAHFICLNSNGYSDITNTNGNSIEEQKAWFRKHMDNVKARAVQPKWFIVYMHDAPFNQMTRRPNHRLEDYNLTLGTPYNVRTGLRDSGINQEKYESDKQFTWSRLLEEYNIDLVLSGHKHTYTRTWPLRENTVDPDLNDPTKNTQNYPVNPWEPLYTTEGRMVMNGDTEFGKGITYVMCQATGYKLQSNKDVPVDGIEWLAKYFPGEAVSGQANATVNKDQKAPTFIVWDVNPNTISMKAYQVINLTTGKQWDHMGVGEAGTTQKDSITIKQIDSVTLNRI